MATRSVSPKHLSKPRREALIWPPLKIAQPGDGTAPQNPFAWFESALKEGAEGIALEVQIFSDDPRVAMGTARSRGPAGACWEQEPPANSMGKLAAASPLPRPSPSRALQGSACPRLCLLSEVLPWVREQRCMAFVAVCSVSVDAAAKVLKAINRAKVRHLIRVIACDLPGLRRLRQLDPKVHLGLQVLARLPAIGEVKALGAEVLLPHLTVASPSFIRRAHRAAMLVIPWTVDSPRRMRRTILEGADGIITNYPARLTETVARLQKKEML